MGVEEPDRLHPTQHACSPSSAGRRQQFHCDRAAAAPAAGRDAAAPTTIRCGTATVSARLWTCTGWYWIAVGVGVVAGLVGVVLIVTSVIGLNDKVDDFQRVDVPATETVYLDEGSYTVYAEDVFLGDSDWSFTGDVEIRDATERLVDLRPYRSRTTYDVSDREGFGVGRRRRPVRRLSRHHHREPGDDRGHWARERGRAVRRHRRGDRADRRRRGLRGHHDRRRRREAEQGAPEYIS